jgi:integrase
MKQVSRLRFGNLRVTLSRTNDNAAWQFCAYISGEKKQVRLSTKTAVLETAKEVAQNVIVDILSKQKSGMKVFSVTFAEARRDFLLDLDKRIARPNGLNKRTANNTINHIGWGIKFLEDKKVTTNTSIDGIRANIWKEYTDWRHKQKATSLTVIEQELVSIRSLFKFSKEKGWCSEGNIPKWDKQPKKEKPKRRRIFHKEVMESLQAVAKWVRNDERRDMFHTVLRTMLNSGMRTGEVLALKRSDVELTPIDATIHIQKTKTGEPRSITIMHSAAVWLRDWMRKHPEEQLFKERVFYQMLKQSRRDKVMSIDPYHMRHQYASDEIRKGQPLHMIARHMGTSTPQLEKTYSQIINAEIGRQFAKTKLVRNEDGTFEVIKRELEK